LNLGWGFKGKASTELGGVETKFDLAPGLIVNYTSRWRF
jgi:hypothetical protein